MKASARQQHLLIDLQNIDTQLLRLARKVSQMPEKTRLAEIEESLVTAKKDFFEKQKTLEDLQFEIERIESDVQLVTERVKLNAQRLEVSSSAKEAANLQEESNTLQRRAGVLEDRQLEMMEEFETAEKVKNEAQSIFVDLEENKNKIERELADALNQIELEKATLNSERAGLAAEVQGDLRELYERTRERYGLGAAKLSGRVSGGSNMELDAADFARVSSLADDEIYFCPVSGVILVRGYDE